MRKEREAIFRLFSTKNSLKFTEIEKSMKIRSNHLAYYLSSLTKEGLLYKKNKIYRLTKKGEQQLPLISSKASSPIPIVLVNAQNDGKVLLIKRDKRPYKNYLGLIGGKMKHDETFEACALRLLKEKANLTGKFKRISSVMHEQVIDEGVKHSFILFLADVEIEDKSNLTPINKLNKEKTIPSDYFLITNKSKITTSEMKDKKGKLSEFRITS